MGDGQQQLDRLMSDEVWCSCKRSGETATICSTCGKTGNPLRDVLAQSLLLGFNLQALLFLHPCLCRLQPASTCLVMLAIMFKLMQQGWRQASISRGGEGPNARGNSWQAVKSSRSLAFCRCTRQSLEALLTFRL